MACNTITEILKSCDSNLGGIVKMWINNGDQIDETSIDTTAGIITAADLASGADTFVEFEFNPNTSNYVETSTISLENSSTFYSQVITIQLSRREAAKRQSLLLIALGQPGLTIFVKDSNGLFWAFGTGDDKAYLTGNDGGSGTAKADLNGYTLTFTCEDVSPALEINETVINGLV